MCIMQMIVLPKQMTRLRAVVQLGSAQRADCGVSAAAAR